MLVIIKGKEVILDDEKGHTLEFSTNQLLEILRILNISITDNGVFLFQTLEFTV